jgi:hypothetical protein
MIKSASFRNFQSPRHVDVDFERLTQLGVSSREDRASPEPKVTPSWLVNVSPPGSEHSPP